MRLCRAGGVIKPWRIRRDAPGTWEIQNVPPDVVEILNFIVRLPKMFWKSDQLVVVHRINFLFKKTTIIEGADSYTGL